MEYILPFPALCPNFSLVGLYRRFGNGKSQAIASVHGSGLISPVKPFEDIFQFITGKGLTGACDRKHTAAPVSGKLAPARVQPGRTGVA